jgi:hypothetical protein
MLLLLLCRCCRRRCSIPGERKESAPRVGISHSCRRAGARARRHCCSKWNHKQMYRHATDMGAAEI